MTDLPEFETITLSWRAPGVLGIRLDRPDERNAVDRAMHHDLISCFHGLHDEPDLGAIILDGAGRTFCAGGSVQMIQSFASDDWRRSVRTMEQGTRLIQEMLSVRPPIVAAVHGAAIGLGATLALLSDTVVLAEDAIIADTHVKVGIVAGDGGTLIWPAVLGPARAKHFLMTGDAVKADQALAWGMVNEVVPADGLEAAALAAAKRYADGPRQAIFFTKQVINARLLREAAQEMPLAIALEARTMLQPDVAEGTQAFLDRRPPDWPSNAPEA